VRTGCLAATGSYVAFIDADLASPPEDLLRLLGALDAGADVAVGVRNHGDGSDMRDQRGIARRMAGRLFSFAMRTLLLPDIGDSQCPLKAFKRGAAQRLFQLQRIDTWSFDAELLFLASRLGLRVAKAPVSWHAVEGSHLKLNLKSAMEVWNLVKIRWQHRGVNARTLAEAPKLA
jgi:dolichyl-phosphate beta-glucosyltransferase